jgi:sugar lactone lactonase YvrE
MKKQLFLVLSVGVMTFSYSQVMVTNFAGGWGSSGYQDGIGSQAKFFSPMGITIDTNNNLYVADTYNNRIRKITPTGVVTTYAGSGIAGYADGNSNVAQFNKPCGLTIDDFGNLLIADKENHRIRKITPSGIVTTVAGSGVQGDAIGLNSNAMFDAPTQITIKGGWVYVSDQSGKIKVIGSQTVTYFAGSGAGYVNGPLSIAKFSGGGGITTDYFGNFYIADLYNNCIRKISTALTASTFAGSQFGIYGNQNGVGLNSSFYYPIGITTDISGDVYVADTQNGLIRKISNQTGLVTTLAGIGNSQSYQDGDINIATFYNPSSLVTDSSGNVYVADSGHNCIRKIIGNILDIEENNASRDITIYPNPAKDHITIDCGALANVVGYSFKITNTLGQEVFNQPMNTQQYYVPLNSWTGQGIYFVNIIDAQGHTIDVRKIILQ